MGYNRRPRRQIQQQIAARVVARSKVTDLTEASTLTHLCGAVGSEIAAAEIRLESIRDSFSLEGATGDLLDERARELPPRGLRRLNAQAASGSVLTVKRQNTSSREVVPVGALTVGRSDGETGTTYSNVEEVTFPLGVSEVQDVAITALSSGVVGNVPVSTVQRLVTAPAFVTEVSNAQPLENGYDREPDGQFRTRIRAYLASIARTMPSSLKYLADTFVAPNGTRARFSAVFEDFDRPGYTELVLDDGSGGAGGQRTGAITSDTVPATGALQLWHERPAIRAIDQIKVTRAGNTLYLRSSLGDFVDIPERGIVYIREGRLLEGDVWEISDMEDGTPYQVYTGLVAALQTEVEGDPRDYASNPGWRASGCRVRVLPVKRQDVFFDIRVIPEPGVFLDELTKTVTNNAVSYFQTLAPGETMYVSRLIAALQQNDDLRSVQIFGSGLRTPLGDVAPSTHRSALRTRVGNISVVPSREV